MDKPNKLEELVILSGKGGTGKTTLTSAFAALSDSLVLADCDVDAADLHLILEPTILKRDPFIEGKEAFVDPLLCTGCGYCADYCRFDAFRDEGDGTYSIDPIRCEGCGVCVPLCPDKAIRFEERHCGHWMISQTRFGTLVHARLQAAGENSGKLVTLVRKEARRIALEEERELLLVDGPPGIGCPVISSITGADKVVLITEPSLSGWHDLERISRLAANFKIPVYVCVNKADIDKKVTLKIERSVRDSNNKFVGTILYDEALVQAQMLGLSPMEYLTGKTRNHIEKIWEKIWEKN